MVLQHRCHEFGENSGLEMKWMDYASEKLRGIGMIWTFKKHKNKITKLDLAISVA